jgi:hypothetical protein
MVFRMRLGASKAEKVYRGIACTTNLRRVRQTTKFRDQKVYPQSFFLRLERRSSHMEFPVVETIRGTLNIWMKGAPRKTKDTRDMELDS